MTLEAFERRCRHYAENEIDASGFSHQRLPTEVWLMAETMQELIRLLFLERARV